MKIPNTKFYIVVGNYGSGKTEISIALAKYIRNTTNEKTVLVDLDIVNPYFRSSEQTDILKKEDIEVKSPVFAMTTVDIPALPAEIQSVFQNPEYKHVIIDVGGDDTGATALGRYYNSISAVRKEMTVLYVINTFRPLSSNKEDICELFNSIKIKSRLTPDYLVNNSNLQRQTTLYNILQGQEIIEEVANEVSTPVGLICGYKHILQQLPKHLIEYSFSIDPVMLPNWLEDDEA